jgi:N-acetylglucosamine-6-sulfatase
VPPGWDLWYAFTESRARYFDYGVNENGTILHFDHRQGDYSTDALKERATRFIADQASKPDPFFMLIATKAVHAQRACATPAPRYAHAFEDVSLPNWPILQHQGWTPQGQRNLGQRGNQGEVDQGLSRRASDPAIGR